MLAQPALVPFLLGVALLQHIAYALHAARPLPAGLADAHAQQRRLANQALRASSFELLALLFAGWIIAAVVPGGALGADASVLLILAFIAGRFMAWHAPARSGQRTAGFLLSLLPTVFFAAAALFGSMSPPSAPAAAQAELPMVSVPDDAGPVGEVPPANPYAEPAAPQPVAAPPEAPAPALGDAEALQRYCGYDRDACSGTGTERQRLAALLASMANVVRHDPDRWAGPHYRDLKAMADRNHPVALYEVAMLLNDLDNDDDKYPLLQQSSAGGHGPASYMLARMNLGADAGADSTIAYYHLAQRQGYDTPELRIALIRELAVRGKPQDCQEARQALASLPAHHPAAVAAGSADHVAGCGTRL